MLSIASARQTIVMLVWALFAGIAIATVSLWFRQRVLGKAIRTLLEHGAIGAKQAMTAEALGIHSRFLLRAMRRGSLARYIHILYDDKNEGGKAPDGDNRPDNHSDNRTDNRTNCPDNRTDESGAANGANGTGEERFYLDEEKKIQAELRYSGKDADLYIVIIALILFLLLALLAARYLPELAVKYLGDYL